MPVLNPEALIDNRVEAIRAYHVRCGIQKAQLDVSGGIDSAVMAGLLVLALGPENVILDHTNINTNPVQTERAVALGKALGCPVAVGDFTKVYEDILAVIYESLRATAEGDEMVALTESIKARLHEDPTIKGSIRSTLRAPLGRAYNRIMGGGIRHGTGNECEDRYLRFYQKGGDGEVDTNPIAMLSKGEVYQLAFALGRRFDALALANILAERDLTPEDDVQAVSRVYGATIKAIPSPDLWGTGDGHSDEAEFLTWTGAPFTYGRINPETGEITSIGTIERVARFLDTDVPNELSQRYADIDEWLFDGHLGASGMDQIISIAVESPYFEGFTPAEVDTFLTAARKYEHITRHKMNPNIPALGNREDLVEAGILTNDLTL